jgi:hypothetical protein
MLALCGIVLPGMSLYLLIFWTGFMQMRSFSFKAFLAALFAVGMICWLKSVCIFFYGNKYNVLENITCGWNNFYELELPFPADFGNAVELIVPALYSVAVLIAIIDNYMNRFSDKIQVRINISFLKWLLSFALAMYLLFASHARVNLIIVLVTSGFALSHFFALADKKWKVCLFIMLTILYLTNYALQTAPPLFGQTQ